MKKKIYAALIAVLLVSNYVHAQNIFPSSGKAGIGTTTPNASSLLEVASTTKGILIPRMTESQRNAIASPATGLIIFQTNNNPGFFYYSGTGWLGLAAKVNTWNVTGNGTIDSASNFIGTTDNGPFSIRTNNTERMYVNSAGKIGIGTTAPGTALDVAGGSWDLSSNEGDFRIGNPTYRMKIGVSTSGGGAGDVRIRAAGGTSRLLLGTNLTDVLTINGAAQVGIGTTSPGTALDVAGGSWDLSSNEGDFRIGNPTYRMKIGVSTSGGGAGDVRIRAAGGTSRLLLGTNLTDVLTINGAAQVGIGTTSPGTALDVVGGSWDLSSNEGDFRIGNPTYRMKIGVSTSGGGAGDVRIRAAGGTSRLLLGTNLADVLTINGAGNVGIGTTNPQYLLSVNGTIQAKEVRVETGWSDFVFDKNYKLRTLSEVEKYISQNHHLPEIPSAAEIQKNGLAIAGVQTKMMQKIEELTLYIIQLQKQIDQLKTNSNENK